jgi:secreted PhoX family phosphatase
MSFSRRNFLQTAAASAAFSGYARLARAQTAAPPAAETYVNEVAGYGPLKPDPYGVFDLPQGFSYRIVSQAGERMSDGLYTPFKADGMGCFPGGGSQVILTRNHELKPADRNFGPFGVRERLETQRGTGLGVGKGRLDPARAYDLDADGHPLPGGVAVVTYDLKTKQTVRQHMALTGTAVNCAGGQTPWGSWLSCEETTLLPGQGGAKDHGWVFEVPASARGQIQAAPLKALGRFQHEAIAIDPRTGVLYLTEDSYDQMGLLYRFLPNTPGKLHRGGRLQAMGFKDSPDAGDSRNHERTDWRQGDWREVVWIDLDGIDNPHADLAQRGHAAGAAFVARGEGIHWGENEVFVCASTGGPRKFGQILRYVPSRFEGQPGERDEPGRLQLFLESRDQSIINNADNITVSPWGHLIVSEDDTTHERRNHLRGVTPDGKAYAIGRNVFREYAELAGVCFSPDGSTLFVNIYWPGITLAITGPWSEFRS